MQATTLLNVDDEPRHFTFVTPPYGTSHCTDEERETQRESVSGLESDSQELTTEAKLKPEAVRLCPQDHTTRLTLSLILKWRPKPLVLIGSPKRLLWSSGLTHCTNQHSIVCGSSNYNFIQGSNEQVMSLRAAPAVPISLLSHTPAQSGTGGRQNTTF